MSIANFGPLIMEFAFFFFFGIVAADTLKYTAYAHTRQITANTKMPNKKIKK